MKDTIVNSRKEIYIYISALYIRGTSERAARIPKELYIKLCLKPSKTLGINYVMPKMKRKYMESCIKFHVNSAILCTSVELVDNSLIELKNLEKKSKNKIKPQSGNKILVDKNLPVLKSSNLMAKTIISLSKVDIDARHINQRRVGRTLSGMEKESRSSSGFAFRKGRE